MDIRVFCNRMNLLSISIFPINFFRVEHFIEKWFSPQEQSSCQYLTPQILLSFYFSLPSAGVAWLPSGAPAPTLQMRVQC